MDDSPISPRSEPVTLRIWTPPKFVRQSPAARAANVVFLNDGQNVFDGTLSLSGAGWEAARGARALAGSPANSGHVIIVGIDHAGDRRSLYYCPSPPGTGAFPQAGLSGFFPEAEAWVGGEAHAYVDRVVSEIVPFVLDRYGVDNRAEQLTFGGSSLGAVSALVMAMRHPRAFGKVLLESPALWIDYGSFFRAVLAYEGEWPQRVYIGMGAREFSGLTPGAPPVEGDPIDAAFASAFGALVGHLREKGLRDDRLLAVLDKTDRGAVHNEFAWSQRFPKALRFLCGRAVKPATPRRGRGIYWTVPRVPSPGQAVQVFFDRPASRTLKATKTPLVSERRAMSDEQRMAEH